MPGGGSGAWSYPLSADHSPEFKLTWTPSRIKPRIAPASRPGSLGAQQIEHRSQSGCNVPGTLPRFRLERSLPHGTTIPSLPGGVRAADLARGRPARGRGARRGPRHPQDADHCQRPLVRARRAAAAQRHGRVPHAPQGPRRARRLAARARRDRGHDGIDRRVLVRALPGRAASRHPRRAGARPARQADPRAQDGRARQPLAGAHLPARPGAAELRAAGGLRRAAAAMPLPAQGGRRPRPGAPAPAEDAGSRRAAPGAC